MRGRWGGRDIEALRKKEEEGRGRRKRRRRKRKRRKRPSQKDICTYGEALLGAYYVGPTL